MKKKLTEQQEFEIMKLVLDKFLWIGFIVMTYGMFRMMTVSLTDGFFYIIIGAVLLILFMILIVREYEIVK